MLESEPAALSLQNNRILQPMSCRPPHDLSERTIHKDSLSASMQDVQQASFVIVRYVSRSGRSPFRVLLYPIICLISPTIVAMDTVNDSKVVGDIKLYDEVLTSKVATIKSIPLSY